MTVKERRAVLESMGFNLSDSGHVSCDQCAAIAINGFPCHETGCPNKVPLCRECGNPDKDGTCCQPVDDDFVGEGE